jgi:hypothetical protein
MESEIKWIVGFCVLFFGTLFGGLFYNDHLTHVERMECVKQRGEWIGKTCIFREHRAQ